MKIVIIGMGSIGKTILKSLSKEKHSITIIDEKREKIESLIEKYDVLGIVGNGACMDIQEEADVSEADLVIAMTRSDELNIMACLVAKKLGVMNTIARVRNPDYRRQIEIMKDDLGIAMIVNPEKETANAIFDLVNLPSVTQIESFAKGKVSLVEVVVEKGCPLVGKNLYSLGSLSKKILICAVQRGNDVIIPSGNFVIEENDKVHFTADARHLGDFLSEVFHMPTTFKNVMVIGGGRITYYLADSLLGKKYNVKVMEGNMAKARELAELLPNLNVGCGNGTEHELLLEEGIKAMDVFVALTDIDEENIIVSMFANNMKVKKTITKVKSEDLYGMVRGMGLNNVVSPKNIVADRITSYIRALSNSRGSNVLTLYKLVNNQVEALEFYAKKQEDIYDKPLRELNIKKNCLIACIIRKNTIIIPDGNTQIKLGDNVVVVTTHKNFDDLIDVFE